MHGGELNNSPTLPLPVPVARMCLNAPLGHEASPAGAGA
jgi:hypothetical protein